MQEDACLVQNDYIDQDRQANSRSRPLVLVSHPASSASEAGAGAEAHHGKADQHWDEFTDANDYNLLGQLPNSMRQKSMMRLPIPRLSNDINSDYNVLGELPNSMRQAIENKRLPVPNVYHTTDASGQDSKYQGEQLQLHSRSSMSQEVTKRPSVSHIDAVQLKANVEYVVLGERPHPYKYVQQRGTQVVAHNPSLLVPEPAAIHDRKANSSPTCHYSKAESAMNTGGYSIVMARQLSARKPNDKLHHSHGRNTAI